MDDKNIELIFGLINKEYVQPIFKDNVDLSSTTKFPISEIISLGVSFAPMVSLMTSTSAASAEIISKLGVDTVYQSFDKVGVAMNLPYKFKDTNFRMGSYIDTSGKTAQSRLKPISIQELTKNTMTFDPMTSIMAAELMYIAKEVNNIKKQQQNMFEYIQIEKRSEIEGNLLFLSKVLNDYKYNYDNKTYKTSMHIKVLDIKQEAEQTINFCRKTITKFLDKNRDDYNSLNFEVQNYKISLFAYAFSSLIETIVLENFDEKYLSKIIDRLENMSYEYKSIYTCCYDYLQCKTEKSISSTILRIAAKTSGKLGNAIAKTKIADKTLIDETLLGGESKINNFRNAAIDKILNSFVNYKEDNVLMFINMIKQLALICNKNNILLFDKKYLYLPDSNE